MKNKANRTMMFWIKAAGGSSLNLRTSSNNSHRINRKRIKTKRRKTELLVI